MSDSITLDPLLVSSLNDAAGQGDAIGYALNNGIDPIALSYGMDSSNPLSGPITGGSSPTAAYDTGIGYNGGLEGYAGLGVTPGNGALSAGNIVPTSTSNSIDSAAIAMGNAESGSIGAPAPGANVSGGQGGLLGAAVTNAEQYVSGSIGRVAIVVVGMILLLVGLFTLAGGKPADVISAVAE